MVLGLHSGDALAMLSQLTAFSTGGRARHWPGFLADQGIHEGSHELDESPQPRYLVVLA